MNISDILNSGQKTKAEQLNTGEVFALWEQLVMRYDVYEMTDIFENFANDVDFRAILTMGKEVLKKEISELEKKMNTYEIPLPPSPPKSINTPANTEVLRDEHMFRLAFMGVQNFLTGHIRSILNSNNENLIDMYIKFEKKELDIFKKLKKYGTLKGWQFSTPKYKGNSSN